jgi:hypothetical protein
MVEQWTRLNVKDWNSSLSVLATQRSQQDCGFNMPEDIAEYFRMISTQCQLDAMTCAMTYLEEN